MKDYPYLCSGVCTCVCNPLLTKFVKNQNNFDMKQKYLFLLMSLLFLLSGVQTSQATITTGYYRVVSYNGKYLTENTSSHSLICSDLMTNNYSQGWYLSVDGTNVTFKNALTDR